MKHETRSYNPKGIAVVVLLTAGFFLWFGLRPIPGPDEFEEVMGQISSTTAVTKSGGNEFDVKIWLNGKPVAYRLAAKLSGERLGQDQFGKGSQVRMLALKSEITKPWTGYLNNVPPSILVSTLTADGKEIVTWRDFIASRQSNRKTGLWGAAGMVALGFVVIVFQKIGLFRRASDR